MSTEVTTVVVEKVSGSKLIRSAFKEAGLDAPAKEIQDIIMREHTREVSEQLVNNIRHQIKKEKLEKKQKRQKLEEPLPVVAVPEMSNEFDKFLLVKDCATKVGGLVTLKLLVEKLEKLLS